MRWMFRIKMEKNHTVFFFSTGWEPCPTHIHTLSPTQVFSHAHARTHTHTAPLTPPLNREKKIKKKLSFTEKNGKIRQLTINKWIDTQGSIIDLQTGVYKNKQTPKRTKRPTKQNKQKESTPTKIKVPLYWFFE